MTATYTTRDGRTVTIPIAKAPVRTRPKRREVAKGYAAKPGTGPDGETCRTCRHATCHDWGNRNYWKCGLRKASWTRGTASDIRLKSPACELWAAKP